ncbi:unnamed protein product [Trichogramma brassicae]|uniref:Uncharacterized protein n=1 Tax=Trichogramma brassicae TaxID=86971 RepID=A0A6H5J2Y6_9HYME|nr:unnamed protein product [Trichogramma brassicae]
MLRRSEISRDCTSTRNAQRLPTQALILNRGSENERDAREIRYARDEFSFGPTSQRIHGHGLRSYFGSQRSALRSPKRQERLQVRRNELILMTRPGVLRTRSSI